MEMETPKSPWRYPHLMFRESRKNHHKTVSFKKSGCMVKTFYLSSTILHHILAGDRNMEFPPGPLMNPNAFCRQDSKDSSISSLSSVPYYGKEELRQTLSVPASAFHVSFIVKV